MASTSAVGTTQNNPNYLGMVFEAGQNATPFLNMVGGLMAHDLSLLGTLQ